MLLRYCHINKTVLYTVFAILISLLSMICKHIYKCINATYAGCFLRENANSAVNTFVECTKSCIKITVMK